jgi:IS30 family transposase
MAELVDDLTARSASQAELNLLQTQPTHLRKTITCDNGSEFANWLTLLDQLEVSTYFADPYSAYQRGTNEHFNGQLRRYLPKRTSFDDLTETELTAIVQNINNRPLKILDWHTPAETHNQALQSNQHHNRCTSE